MHFILLSGGSGKRLWPLSNDVRSKQFLKLFRDGEGGYESMVQRVYRQLRMAAPNAGITVATSRAQVSSLRNQLGEDISICVEPCRRDTFPAIALSCAFLRDVLGADENECVVVCPVDPYVDGTYFQSLVKLCTLAEEGGASLSLMGIEPTYPSEKYGYILPEEKKEISRVSCFREKPDMQTAKAYIAQGALWNGGVFAFLLGWMMEKTREITGISTYTELLAGYDSLRKISFDYAIAEKESSLQVLRYSGQWADLGTWNTLTEAIEEKTVGKAYLDDTCENVHVINETGLPVVCMGLKNLVVAAGPEGILVSDKPSSSYIKPYVEKICQQAMYAEKSWGSYRVLDVGENSLTILVTLLPGHRMHYHSHQCREESWTVTAGSGVAVVDDREISMEPGQVLRLPAGCRHTLIARTAMTVVEVQIGSEISVQDKIKYPMEPRYGAHE